MKRIFSRLAALAALFSAGVCAQDLSGQWQGTLPTPQRDLRIVFKLSKTPSPGFQVAMYSIDQAARAFAGTATLQGATVKISVPGLGVAYEGKLETDGVNLTGTWTQGGGTSLPLSLKHVNQQDAWALPEPPAKLKPMTNADPAFEVATIKPSKPETQGKGVGVRGRELSTLNTTLADLMEFAYGIHPRQIAGGPSWLDSERYDILGKPEGEGQPNDRQWKIMVQKLLTERFKLAFHHEQKELSVYAITVAKTGSKMTKSAADPNGLPGLGMRALGNLSANNANMQDFAQMLQSVVLDRPVVDQTGLSGRFDFSLRWTPDETQFTNLGIKVPVPPATPDSPPDLFTALQEQLGLKIAATRAPVEMFVIDRAEKYSEN